MKAIKTIGEICLVFLACFSILVCGLFIYYHFFVNDVTIGVNNIADQLAVDVKKEDDLSEEEKNVYDERWFLEANYYSNDKENGIELQELNLNYFTGYNLTENEYRSTGMQYVGHWENYNVKVSNMDELNKYVYPDFYYYDTSDHISWSGQNISSRLNRNQAFIVKIDNRPFLIQLDKSVRVGWWIFGRDRYYTYSMLFESVFEAIESNSAGYGDYYITVDLSEMFSVREYDSESEKFLDDDVTDIIKNYAVMKFHYDENGARNSTQSIFKSIQCSSKYDLNDKVDTTYWQERVVYSLTEKDLIYRYSSIYDGYFMSLGIDFKEMFANMPRTKVNVVVDLDSEFMKSNKYNVVGIDYNGFENFEIDTLTILGKPQTFHILEKGLFGSNLQTLKHSVGIGFDKAPDSFNNEYLEVVV